jgi:CheY-like chemotaxis protein
VAVAYSGPEAIAVAKQVRPEVVLCDIALPGMDGYAVADALKRDADTAGARLIAISGYGSPADDRRCRQAGFERLLTKPVDPAELQRVLPAGPTPPAAAQS